jgi:hypothetical protein
MEHLFNQFIDGFGLSSAHVIVLLVTISLVSQVIGRLIPDDATGLLGVIRQISKVLGLYVSNRVSSGVSVNDVTRSVVESALPDRVTDIENRAILKPFPEAEVHVSTRGKDGKFAKLESPWFVSLIAFALLIPLLGGCATAGASTQIRPALQALCNSTPLLAVAINEIRDDQNRQRALFGLRALESACPLIFPTALREANRLRANA